MKKFLLKKVKDLDHLDLALIKGGMIFLMLFILKLIPDFMDWVNTQNLWMFLIIGVALFLRPCYKTWKQ